MRAFISRLSSMGDVVCTLPIASALKQLPTRPEIYWAIDPRFAGIAESCKHIDHVVEWPKSLSEARRMARSMPEFDVAIDAQGLFKSAWSVLWVRAKRRLGYAWQREGSWLVSSKVRPDVSSIHVTDQMVDIARYLGSEVEHAEFGLAPTLEALRKTNELLEPPDVLLNAGAGWESKRWPSEYFAELARDMHSDGRRVAFIGSSGERDSVDRIRAKGAEFAANLAGQTSISELIALLSQSKLHVAGDTGSLHIAAGLGVSTIGLYSITRPERTGPYGQVDRCFFDPAGLRYIGPDAVVDRARALLSSTFAG